MFDGSLSRTLVSVYLAFFGILWLGVGIRNVFLLPLFDVRGNRYGHFACSVHHSDWVVTI